MVAMLMSQQHRIQRFWSNTDALEPPEDLFPAEPGINQQTRMLGRHKRCVSGAAAGENANPDDSPAPLSL